MRQSLILRTLFCLLASTQVWAREKGRKRTKPPHVKVSRIYKGGIAFLFVWGLVLAPLTGCSVYKASNQPDKKDTSVLDVGTHRSRVLAELGSPTWSGEKDGEKVDVFTFVQGYSKGAKVGRAFFHGAADVVTLGLWEVVGTPIETVATGTQMKVEVGYDEQERVKRFQYLSEK